MHEWDIRSEDWEDQKDLAHYGDGHLVIIVRNEGGEEVAWIGIPEVLDSIGSRYAIAHILSRIKQGVESKPALMEFRHMAGEIAAFGEVIAQGTRTGLAKLEKRKARA